MPRALISVANDGFAYLSLNGAASRYSDAGQALAYLGDYARETASDVAVTIDQGSQQVEVTIDHTGKVSTTPPGETQQTRAIPSPPPSGSAPPAEAARPPAAASSPANSPRTQTPPPGNGSSTDPDAPSSAKESSDAEAGGDEYPLGTPFSGPAAGTAPAHKRSRVRKKTGNRQPQRLKKITVPGLVLIGLAILMIGAFVIPNFIPAGSTETPQTINTDEQINPRSDLSVSESDDIVPSFDSNPAWEAKVPASASVTASDRGVLVVDEGNLQVLDAQTGDMRYSGKASEPPTFAVDTLIEGEPALLWQVGNTAEALFDGASSPKTYQLPVNARISSAGTSVLVKSGNKLSTFGRDGLIDIPTPESGTTPMAIENDNLYSADYDGPVFATNIKTKSEREIHLEAPSDDLEIIKWISAGHGKVITLWGEQGASTNSGHRIQLVVHSLEDGSILSTVTTTTDIVGEMSWVRGQGGQRAYIGPYLFDMTTGLLLMDTSRNDIHFSEPKGTIVPCTIGSDSSCLLAGKNAYRSDTRLLALTDSGNMAVVSGPDSTIRAFEKKPTTPEK